MSNAELDLRKQISDQALEIARLLKLHDSLAQRSSYKEWLKTREQVAVLEQLLSEALRGDYINEARCSQSWLAEARKAITHE